MLFNATLDWGGIGWIGAGLGFKEDQISLNQFDVVNIASKGADKGRTAMSTGDEESRGNSRRVARRCMRPSRHYNTTGTPL
jgi:hypothetical protein